MSKLISSLKRKSWRKSSSGSEDLEDIMDGEVYHEGFLEKRTGVGVIKSTRKQWFQLQARELKYYKTNPKWESSSPKGIINIADLQTVKTMSLQHHHFVQIITLKEKFSLYGESASYCEEWVAKLHQAMQRLRQSSVSVCAPDSPPARGRSMKQKMSTLVEEGDQAAKNGKNDYELIDSSADVKSGDRVPTSEDPDDLDDSLYETVQPVGKSAPSTVTKPQEEHVGDDRRHSNSSGYYSGFQNEQDPDDVFERRTPSPTPQIPVQPTAISSPGVDELRRLLIEMGADFTVDKHGQENSNGIEEVRQFIRERFFEHF